MSAPHFLAGNDFARVVRLAPLVSIDILVKDPQGYTLLGLRVNEPAKGKYFVPASFARMKRYGMRLREFWMLKSGSNVLWMKRRSWAYSSISMIPIVS
jgi:hypothetical protein